MDIGKLFRDAWGLFTKDVGPLIVGMLIALIIPAVGAGIVVAVTVGTSLSGLEVNAQGQVTGFKTLNVALLGVGMALIVVVLVFLSVPLYVGLLQGVLRRVREGRPMAYGDAFNGFGMFGRAVGAAVLLAVVYCLILLVPGGVIAAGALAHSSIVIGVGVVLEIAAVVLYVYLLVCWIYAFPVIVDRRLGVMEAMVESRALVHGAGWWWTFLALFILEVVVGAVSFVLGLIPIVGAVATIVLYPFVITWVVAMYLQARREGQLIDAVTGYRSPVAGGVPAYSQPVSPYAPPPQPPAPPPGAGYGYAAPPAAGQANEPPAGPGLGHSPAPPPSYATPPAVDAGTYVPDEPAVPEPPAAPEPPAPAGS